MVSPRTQWCAGGHAFAMERTCCSKGAGISCDRFRTVEAPIEERPVEGNAENEPATPWLKSIKIQCIASSRCKRFRGQPGTQPLLLISNSVVLREPRSGRPVQLEGFGRQASVEVGVCHEVVSRGAGFSRFPWLAGDQGESQMQSPDPAHEHDVDGCVCGPV